MKGVNALEKYKKGDLWLSTKHIIVPPACYTKLKWISSYAILNGAGNFASKTLVANGIYDVDPSLGSTSTAGFAELAALWGSFRVHKTRVKVDFNNNDTQPYIVAVGFATQQSHTVNSWNSSTYGNDYIKTFTVSGKGGQDRKQFRATQDLAAVIGDRDYYFSDVSYVGTAGSNPTSEVSFLLGTAAAASGTNGVFAYVELTFFVEFFNRLKLSS